MTAFGGYGSAVLDALPDAPPGLPAGGVREILGLRLTRTPSEGTVYKRLDELRRCGLVRVRQGRPRRWYRA